MRFIGHLGGFAGPPSFYRHSVPGGALWLAGAHEAVPSPGARQSGSRWARDCGLPPTSLIKCSKDAISLHPDLALAHHNLGSALLHKGKADEAIVSFKQALR